MLSKVVLVSLLLLATEARPAHRSKRGLGLIKLGYDWATQGLSAGMSDGLLSGFSDLSTGGKIGAGLMIAKPLALTLLGKYALYDWLTKGSSAGFQADLGFGPFKASGNAGFGASYNDPEETVLGDFWYEPITSDNLPPAEENDVAVQDVTPVEVLEAEDDSNLANFQAGVSLGPVNVNAGLGVGR